MKRLVFLLSIVILFVSCKGANTTSNTPIKVMNIDTFTFNTIYSTFKEPALKYRRFKHSDIDSLIQLHKGKGVLAVNQIGKSFEGRAIYELTYGTGEKKVMLWSQMHGDEPTATMALFDLFNFLEGKGDGHDEIRKLLTSKLSIHFIPMLNPDGAERYQRRTAQGIDMNRDARAGHTVEGALLRARAQEIKPQYGFNLHDQNIYYNVPGTKNPVSISLLAPAYNEPREINPVRENAMKIAAGMNEILQQYIPDAVAKYDDTYTPRGFGDNFQSWDASTVLIESGGMKGDPEKQQIRKLNFIIILNALVQIAEGSYAKFDKQQYEDIPFNASQLHDVVIRNIVIGPDSTSFKTDLAIRRNETTIGRDFFVRGKIEDIGDLKESFGYDEIDAEGLHFVPAKTATLILNDINQLTAEQAFDLLRKGFMAVQIKEVGETKEKALHSLPIHLFTQTNFYLPVTADFGGMANFYIGDTSGNLKYAIMNGYLIDLSKDFDKQITLKNRVH
ncbi:MAG: M14 family zinc carboxypeptidase [Sphingobacterium composti]|uniref:M14 family zinc carboxypeptidase n=1 Tax=Sphingobacterium composti TaxID=363260 RepID=UPI001F21A271|nr:M14 family zinc carboxypeptidase [Sphingobacterium composti Ten et al. 2007 non Yoo et al. 2007]